VRALINTTHDTIGTRMNVTVNIISDGGQCQLQGAHTTYKHGRHFSICTRPDDAIALFSCNDIRSLQRYPRRAPWGLLKQDKTKNSNLNKVINKCLRLEQKTQTPQKKWKKNIDVLTFNKF
jgi:hypothetical protein